MTAEEIIERLLDERKITVKEAIILLKAIINVVADDWIGRFKRIIEDPNKKSKEPPDIQKPLNPWKDNIVVMYGVQTYPSISSISSCNTSSSTYTISSDANYSSNKNDD